MARSVAPRAGVGQALDWRADDEGDDLDAPEESAEGAGDNAGDGRAFARAFAYQREDAGADSGGRVSVSGQTRPESVRV
jgi:hypothetical protein